MRKYLKYLLLLIVIVGLISIFVRTPTKPITPLTTSQPQEILIDTADFVGKTALEATENSAKEIKLEGFGINAYVTSLNGNAADPKKNEFWELIINGESSKVGAGSYIIKAGDKIIWRINTY